MNEKQNKGEITNSSHELNDNERHGKTHERGPYWTVFWICNNDYNRKHNSVDIGYGNDIGNDNGDCNGSSIGNGIGNGNGMVMVLIMVTVMGIILVMVIVIVFVMVIVKVMVW